MFRKRSINLLRAVLQVGRFKSRQILIKLLTLIVSIPLFFGINTLPIVRTARYFQCKIICEECTSANLTNKIWVDPNDIKYQSPNHTPRIYGEVRGGDWDENIRPLCERDVHSGLRQYFEEGIPADQTPLYCDFKKAVRVGRWDRYTAVSQFEARIQEIENLYESMESYGYRTQSELFTTRKKEVITKNNDALHPFMNEIEIDIGRDGSLLWRYSGQHRLAIAQLLNIDQIPVLVVTRHRHWEWIRTQDVESDLPQFVQSVIEKYADHPDTSTLANR